MGNIKTLTAGSDGKIHMTQEQLQALTDEAYSRGVTDGKAQTPYIPYAPPTVCPWWIESPSITTYAGGGYGDAPESGWGNK